MIEKEDDKARLERLRTLKSRMFLNRNKLSPRFIPKILPHREDQIKLLFSLFEDALEHIEATYLRVSQIVGGVGTGKTCTAIRFGNRLQEEAFKRKIRLKHVYLNCKLEGSSRFILYKSLLEKSVPEISTRSLSPEEMLQQLMKHLQNEDKYLVVSLMKSTTSVSAPRSMWYTILLG